MTVIFWSIVVLIVWATTQDTVATFLFACLVFLCWVVGDAYSRPE